MKVKNIRLGFATNSSSSHSIIFDNSLRNIHDENDDTYFGWEFFTLASKEAKKEYLSAMIYENFRRDGMNKDLINIILKGMELPKLEGIDHQSLYYFPKEYGSDYLSIKFVNDFKNYLLKDGVYVLGGNDNEDIEHPLYNEEKLLNTHVYYTDWLGWVCRKDGDWWILYNKKSGNRAIFSFEEFPSEFIPESPLLIDFKITDYCDKNCEFCYMGSSINGKHIDKNNIYKLCNDIAREEVFEIAIGGGEPTKCPHFTKIINHLHREGVIVNFSTASFEWLENKNYTNDILNKIGAFAFSINDVETLSRLLTIMKLNDYDLNKLTIQVIPDAISKKVLKDILILCYKNNIRTTLLGFKEVERGSSFERTGTEKIWIDVLKELSNSRTYPTISIDTTLANRSKDQLEEEDISDYLYHTMEGLYSAYIDGVEMKFGPSSYEPEKLIDYDINLHESFQKIQSKE